MQIYMFLSVLARINLMITL